MIVVTGMHRSGTSLTAALLNRLGAPFGDPAGMIAADRWNQRGYFENSQAIGINLRLLLGLNVDVDHWIDPPANPLTRLATAFTSGKWRYLMPASEATVRARADTLASEMADFGTRTEGVFVKDPRFSLTYRYWRERVRIEGAVFCFRHPEAVRRSITRRDLMPKAVSTRLWLQHNRGFINSLTGDEPVLLVDYDRFFGPDARDCLQRLVRFVSAQSGGSAGVEAAFKVIDMDQRHHDTPETLSDNREADAVYRALKAVSADQDATLPAAALRDRLTAAGFP